MGVSRRCFCAIACVLLVGCAADKADESFRLRFDTAIAGMDGKVLAVDGGSRSGTSPVVASFDPTSEQWTQVPNPPFESPLYTPVIQPEGDRVLVAGVPCDDLDWTADSSAPCGVGNGLVGAIYDTRADEWSEVAALESSDAPSGIIAGGWADDVSVVWAQSIFGLDANTGEWEKLPDPPLAFTNVCATDGQVYAAQVNIADRDNNNEPLPLNEQGSWDPVAVSVLDLDTMRWSAPQHSNTFDSPQNSYSFTCAPDGVAVVEYTDADTPSAALHFTVDGGWEPEPGPAPMTTVIEISNGTDGTFFGTGDSWIMLVPPRHGRWQQKRIEREARGLAAVSATRVAVLVSTTDEFAELRIVDFDGA